MKKQSSSLLLEESTYTGRQKELDLFFDTLDCKEWDQYKILSYYGIGGIGKTELRKELMKELESYSVADFTYINFESNDMQQVEKALVHLRTEIGKKYRVPFTVFDAAYVIYMKKTNNTISLNDKTFPFVQEGSWVVEVIAEVAKNPYIALGAKLIEIVSKRININLSREDRAKIRKFEMMEANELLKWLPILFAEDLDKYLIRSHNKFVIFIDTYEALWTDQRMKAYEFRVDKWVRDLITQLPNVLWVVFGREPVAWSRFDEEWDDAITKVQLGELSEDETKELLSKLEISDAAIQDEIYRNSKGHPYSIYLSHDTYTKISKTHQPTAADFKGLKTPEELFERFIRYLLKAEKRALELLALTNSWDIDTYLALMKRFDTKMNEDDHDDLAHFSFITKLEDGRWEMHQLMRESLIDFQDTQKAERGRSFLFDHFKSQLSHELVRNEPHDAGNIINQAFYQGFILMEHEKITLTSFIDWFRAYDYVFLKIKANYLTLPLLKQLKNFLGSSTQSMAEEYLGIILYDIAYIYMDEERDYSQAEPFFTEALELREQKFPDDKIKLAKSYYGLATLYQRMGRNTEAEELHLKAFSLREQYCDPTNIVGLAFSSNGLGRLYQDLNEYEKALHYYKNALEIYESIHDNTNIPTAMMNLISCYHDMHRYDKAYELSLKVREIIESDGNSNQITYAKMLNTLGTVITAKDQFAEALELLQGSYEIFKNRIGEECLEVSKVLHNMALTYKLLNKEADYVDKLTKCIEIKTKLISVKKLTEDTLNYRYTNEMALLLKRDTFEYSQLRFNF